jgi:hypothetical protein
MGADRARCPIPDRAPASALAAHLPGLSRQLAVDEKAAARRTLIAVAIFAAILVPLLVVAAVTLQGPGATSIHAIARLPDRVHVCGRSYRGPGSARPIAAIRLDGIEPVLVDTGPLAPCPVGACTTVALSSGCATVVYIRVGDDAYVPYELLGGP